MSFNNLPSRAAALAAGAPRVQLRTSYAAGWCLDFVTSEHEEPTEGMFLVEGYALLLIGDRAEQFRRCFPLSLKTSMPR